jgi:hypothetical protein
MPCQYIPPQRGVSISDMWNGQVIEIDSDENG